MQFQINSKSLLSALSAVGRVVPAKVAIQILSSFHIKVSNGEVAITAADTENRATITLQAITDGEGAFCVEAKFLTDIVRSLPDCLVTVVVAENGEMTITTDKNTFNAVTQDGNVFPEDNFDEDGVVEPFSIATDTLLTGFAETSFAVGTDDFHPQMMGVCLDIKPDQVVFVATDTRRMVKSKFEAQLDVDKRCIIPTKAILAVNALAAKSLNVDINLFPTAIQFSGENFTMRSQLVKGNYPDYNRVIPQNNSIKATFNRAAVLSAARRVAACADSNYGMLRFAFDMGEVVISTSDTSYNRSAKETVECDFGNNPMKIGLSADLLTSLLSAANTDKVTFNMADANRPVVLTADGDEHLTMLLMPMNINE